MTRAAAGALKRKSNDQAALLSAALAENRERIAERNAARAVLQRLLSVVERAYVHLPSGGVTANEWKEAVAAAREALR